MRRIYVCIERLVTMPGRSALLKAIDPKAEWSHSEYLMSEIIDRLEMANWLKYRMDYEDDKMPMPDKFPRPGIELTSKEDAFASNEEVANVLAFNF